MCAQPRLRTVRKWRARSAVYSAQKALKSQCILRQTDKVMTKTMSHLGQRSEPESTETW